MSLKKRETRICQKKGCNNEFELTVYNRIFCDIHKDSRITKNKQKSATKNNKLGQKSATNLPQNFELNGFKILDKIDGLVDRIYFILRASKIQKYPIEIQEKCRDNINNIIIFLENELKNMNGGKKIIEISNQTNY